MECYRRIMLKVGALLFSLTLPLVNMVFAGSFPTLDDHHLEVVILDKEGSIKYLTLSQEETTEGTSGKNFVTPLGSLWKLFVFIYVKANHKHPPAYKCSDAHEDLQFCCLKKGESIEMEQALVQSCGPFFESDHLKIDQASWISYWKQEYGVSYHWLLNKDQLKPDTMIPVKDLLNVLHHLRTFDPIYREVRATLAKVFIYGSAGGSHRYLGSEIRAKTYTWDDPENDKKLIGGFAGWLNDNSVIWSVGKGSSSAVIKKFRSQLAELVQDKKPAEETSCVSVSFFSSYPIQRIVNIKTNDAVTQGVLTGDFRIDFKNGNRLKFRSNQDVV